jgi:hypothetical protein
MSKVAIKLTCISFSTGSSLQGRPGANARKEEGEFEALKGDFVVSIKAWQGDPAQGVVQLQEVACELHSHVYNARDCHTR